MSTNLVVRRRSRPQLGEARSGEGQKGLVRVRSGASIL
jgi:hypothetical protein